jgi:hypothetical protein
MTKFFFNIRDHDEYIEDAEGVELPGLGAAREEAISAAREMIADKVLRGEVIDGHVFEVTDETGEILERIPFKSVISLG